MCLNPSHCRAPFSLLPSPFSLLPSSYFLLPTSNFLLPSPFSLLLSSFFLLPSSFSQVLAKGREFFGCDTLNGVELENQPTGSSCQLLGSHWEQRLLRDDLMASTSTSFERYLSPMTLALFADSGWYVRRRRACCLLSVFQSVA